jgi:ribonuclease-3
MLVQSQSLADKAKSIKLNKAVKLSKGTANLQEDNKQSIYEGCFESLIGAIFLDGGWDQATIVAISLFSKELDEISLENSFKDPKTQLQEVFQSRGMSPPTYSHFENNSGFECSLTFQEKCYSSLSKSKQGAEVKVAEKVLKDIGHTS